MGKHKGKLIGLLTLLCIPLAFFFLQPNNLAQATATSSVKTELEEKWLTKGSIQILLSKKYWNPFKLLLTQLVK